MIKISALILFVVYHAMSNANTGSSNTQSEFGLVADQTEAHQNPAAIKMMDMYSNEVTMKPVEEVPENRRFLFLRDGTEVSSREEADEIVPITEVRMFPLNDQGELVPKEQAAKIRIEEFGPDGVKLRWTILVPSRQAR